MKNFLLKFKLVKYLAKLVRPIIKRKDPNHFSRDGDNFFSRKEYHNAIKKYNKAIELNNKNEVFFFKRGNVKLKLGIYKGAIYDFTKALEIDPNYLVAFSLRAKTKEMMSNHEEAIKDYKRILEIKNYNCPLTLKNIGLIYEKIEKYPFALNYYSDSLKLCSKYFGVYKLRGKLNAKLKNNKRAIDDFDKELSNDPLDYLAYFLRAKSKFELCDFEGAALDYMQAYILRSDTLNK